MGRVVSAKTAPTIHPTIGDIRQAVGLYEGEGTAARASGGGRHASRFAGPYHLQVTISQNDRECLDWMRERFGGTVRPHRGETFSRWALSGPRARGFIMTIYSHLTKRRQRQVRQALGLEPVPLTLE
jgi:hypothetical protein